MKNLIAAAVDSALALFIILCTNAQQGIE